VDENDETHSNDHNKNTIEINKCLNKLDDNLTNSVSKLN
jgi:hypothetical protein